MADVDRSSDPSFQSKTPSLVPSSSRHSSLLASRPPAVGSRSLTKLRPQYPRGSTDNHVEYILVASFDIDRGPVMEHQYPVAITGDENMLAELMLPDQAHARNQDWTIFFLHKDTSQEEEEAEREERERRRRSRRRRRRRHHNNHHGAAGLVRDFNDPHPSYPTDGVANGQSDQGTATDDDETDYQSDDDADDALQPNGYHYDDYDDYDSTDSEPEGGEGPPLIYVLNLVNTKHDKSVKRGAVVKAMAICTRHPFLHIYKVSSHSLHGSSTGDSTRKREHKMRRRWCC